MKMVADAKHINQHQQRGIAAIQQRKATVTQQTRSRQKRQNQNRKTRFYTASQKDQGGNHANVDNRTDVGQFILSLQLPLWSK